MTHWPLEYSSKPRELDSLKLAGPQADQFPSGEVRSLERRQDVFVGASDRLARLQSSGKSSGNDVAARLLRSNT
jgi:hypothetical protein